MLRLTCEGRSDSCRQLDNAVAWPQDCSMIRPVQVTALSDYRLRIVFSDGVEGDLDVSDIVGRGVFEPLRDEAFFARVHLGQQGQIAWNEELEICPDAAYIEITGRVPAEATDA
jgi:hypothetical protein